MPTIIAEVGFRAEAPLQPPAVWRGIAEHADGKFKIDLSGPNGAIVSYECGSEGSAIKLLRVEIQERLGLYDPNLATIHIDTDTAALITRTSYRCPVPTCRTKLLEAWGPVHGITIVCRKCKTRSVPVPERA